MGIEALGFIAGDLYPPYYVHQDITTLDSREAESRMTDPKSVAVIGGEINIRVYRSLRLTNNHSSGHIWSFTGNCPARSK